LFQFKFWALTKNAKLGQRGLGRDQGTCFWNFGTSSTWTVGARNFKFGTQIDH